MWHSRLEGGKKTVLNKLMSHLGLTQGAGAGQRSGCGSLPGKREVSPTSSELSSDVTSRTEWGLPGRVEPVPQEQNHKR